MSVGVGDLSRSLAEPNSNLGLRDWKSESFESWTFFSLRVDSTKHDDCCAEIIKQSLLMHASVQSLRRLSSTARDQFGYMLRQNPLICRSTSNSIPPRQILTHITFLCGDRF